MEMLVHDTPPSGLPAISPSRGEIDSFGLAAFPTTPAIDGAVETADLPP